MAKMSSNLYRQNLTKKETACGFNIHCEFCILNCELKKCPEGHFFIVLQRVSLHMSDMARRCGL